MASLEWYNIDVDVRTINERIREIRASERKFYQKITDIYATAIDYDKNSATTKRFYATVQNKMHYAVHSYTVAELLVTESCE